MIIRQDYRSVFIKEPLSLCVPEKIAEGFSGSLFNISSHSSLYNQSKPVKSNRGIIAIMPLTQELHNPVVL
jgi:hypothetical protein